LVCRFFVPKDSKETEAARAAVVTLALPSSVSALQMGMLHNWSDGSDAGYPRCLRYPVSVLPHTGPSDRTVARVVYHDKCRILFS